MEQSTTTIIATATGALVLTLLLWLFYNVGYVNAVNDAKLLCEGVEVLLGAN